MTARFHPLKEARLQAAITQTRLAEEAGVSRPVLLKAEKGQQAITYINAVKIVHALNRLTESEHTIESLGIVTY